MIIDGYADFRSLLMHHVTTLWPDAIISTFDPIMAGQLPEAFSGAGNDIILLGSHQGDIEPLPPLACSWVDSVVRVICRAARARWRRYRIL